MEPKPNWKIRIAVVAFTWALGIVGLAGLPDDLATWQRWVANAFERVKSVTPDGVRIAIACMMAASLLLVVPWGRVRRLLPASGRVAADVPAPRNEAVDRKVNEIPRVSKVVSRLEIVFDPATNYAINEIGSAVASVLVYCRGNVAATNVRVQIEKLIPVSNVKSAQGRAIHVTGADLRFSRALPSGGLTPESCVKVDVAVHHKGSDFRFQCVESGTDGVLAKVSPGRYRLVLLATADNAQAARKAFTVGLTNGNVMTFREREEKPGVSEPDPTEAESAADPNAARLEIHFDKKANYTAGAYGPSEASVIVRNAGPVAALNPTLRIQKLLPRGKVEESVRERSKQFANMGLRRERDFGKPLIPDQSTEYKVARLGPSDHEISFYLSQDDGHRKSDDDNHRYAWRADYDLFLEAIADNAPTVVKAFTITIREGVMDFSAKPVRRKRS